MYHKNLKQPLSYLLTNQLSNSQASLLFNMRVQCVRGKKENFHKHYKRNPKCDLCKIENNNHNHILNVKGLNNIKWNNKTFQYEHIFRTSEGQISVTILLSAHLQVRDWVLEELADQTQAAGRYDL